MNAQELIQELERRTKKVPQDTREAFLDEIRAHLDASIQARMEIGASFAEASQQAAEELGPVKLIARRLNRVHEIGPNKPFAVAVYSFVAGFAGLLALNWNMVISDETTGLAFVVVLALGLAGVIVTAFRARKFQWKTLLCVYPVASVIFAAVGASAYAPDTLPPALGTNYHQAAEWAQQNLEHARVLEQQGLVIKGLKARFEAGENIAPPKSFDWESGEGRKVDSREAAQKAWDRFGFNFEASARWERDEARRLLSLNQAFWWKGIPHHLIGMQPIAGPWTLILAAISLIAAVTAQGWDRLRKRFRRV